MASRSRRALGLGGIGVVGTIAAVAVGLTTGPAAVAGGGCDDGTTTFDFKVPEGVTLEATFNAVKRSPSKIEMITCGGSFDPATGSGRLNLEGGVNFEYKNNRGPTGNYRITYGGVGKLRVNVVGEGARIAKVTGGSVNATGITNAKLKLTSKGAKLLNESVEAASTGPWAEGRFGKVSSTVIR